MGFNKDLYDNQIDELLGLTKKQKKLQREQTEQQLKEKAKLFAQDSMYHEDIYGHNIAQI